MINFLNKEIESKRTCYPVLIFCGNETEEKPQVSSMTKRLKEEKECYNSFIATYTVNTGMIQEKAIRDYFRNTKEKIEFSSQCNIFNLVEDLNIQLKTRKSFIYWVNPKLIDIQIGGTNLTDCVKSAICLKQSEFTNIFIYKSLVNFTDVDPSIYELAKLNKIIILDDTKEGNDTNGKED